MRGSWFACHLGSDTGRSDVRSGKVRFPSHSRAYDNNGAGYALRRAPSATWSSSESTYAIAHLRLSVDPARPPAYRPRSQLASR